MDSEHVDLSIALKHLHKLQQEDGDLGAEYWYRIATLLQNASLYQKRAEQAEALLREHEERIRRAIEELQLTQS